MLVELNQLVNSIYYVLIDLELTVCDLILLNWISYFLAFVAIQELVQFASTDIVLKNISFD